MPQEIEKCIILDVDICVLKDLSGLFNIDLKDNYIAGVKYERCFSSKKKNVNKLNLPSLKYYINTGVILINLSQIRKNNMTQKFIELSKTKYTFQDQDILNIACFGKILLLPPKYNVIAELMKKNKSFLKKLYKEDDIIEARESPYIIHYSSKKKPWNNIGIYMEKYWWNIAKKTPYINNIFNRENIYRKAIKKFWYLSYKKKLNLEKPRTFNEKMQWLKLYDSTPIKTRLSDKYLVRDWIKEKIGEEYLIPLLGVYDKFEDIDFKKLPNQFVIKCNQHKKKN